MDRSELDGFAKWIQNLILFETPKVEDGFLSRSLHDRLEFLGAELLEHIRKAPEQRFLLPGLMRWISSVNELGLASPLQYQISSFESWLQRNSLLAEDEQRMVRGKIMGQYLPRPSYQILFPIGQDHVLPGSHIVTGHSSPDLDTTVASFWGWCDAFAAPTNRRLHHWNIPGGLPDLEEVQLLFVQLFGDQILFAPKVRTSLALTAFDLLTENSLPVLTLTESLQQMDADEWVIAVTGPDGHVVGELRPIDIDLVRQITNPIMDCVRWIERHIQEELIDFFAKASPSREELSTRIDHLRKLSLVQTEPFSFFSEEQRENIASITTLILRFPKGIETPICEWSKGLDDLLSHFHHQFDRSEAFQELSKLTHELSSLGQGLRQLLERVDTALQIKREVLHRADQWVGVGADVEEMRNQLEQHRALMVVVSSGAQGVLPEGIVLAHDLRASTLGTVTMRDFSNREEVRVPPYLELIGALDHHKTDLQTQRPPTVTIADVQSANTLVAEAMISLQTEFASGGWEKIRIQHQLQHSEEIKDGKRARLQRRLLCRLQAVQQNTFWVSAERQWWQAVFLIFAILDDTDLLSKISWRDVDILATLLDLVESLDRQEEVEFFDFSELPRNQEGCRKAAEQILHHQRLKNWIHTVYQAKELTINQQLALASKGEPSHCFRDLKIQNHCAAISQLKLFPGNLQEFDAVKEALRAVWLRQSEEMFKQRSEIDLYIHMVSTIRVEDPERKTQIPSNREDELWIWTPPPEASRVHLRVFLTNLFKGPLAGVQPLSVSIEGPMSLGLQRIVEEAMQHIPVEKGNAQLAVPMVVLKFPASLLNSRKAMITPNLPGGEK